MGRRKDPSKHAVDPKHTPLQTINAMLREPLQDMIGKERMHPRNDNNSTDGLRKELKKKAKKEREKSG